ncbi:MAG TPA: serine--tRNA ligase [Candidatus Dormibacteraeota bacterium]|nr:serine--tRNA ligase [Candidatus Dormibacteraeota bacterium]
MLDIQFIRKNAQLVEDKSTQKGYKVDVHRLIELSDQMAELTSDLMNAQRQRNALVADKKQRPTDEQIQEGREIRSKIEAIQARIRQIEPEYVELHASIPNITPDDTPVGGEEANRQERLWGKPREDRSKDHLTWGEQRGLIDFERGAKVAGAKFYFLKGDLVRLEMALFQYALGLATKYGFTPMSVPHLVNGRTIRGTGFGAKGDEQQIYKIEGQDLHLIATAEIPLTGYHTDEILNDAELPILYAGLSPAYRMEAGSYGKYSKGLYRVHQFNKLELYVFCKPEDSQLWHEKLVQLEEELCQNLEIPYRVVRIASGDLGMPAYKKFDIEYWSPPEKEYRELMSSSNVTDYQARRLNIRYRTDNNKTAFIHTLNATAAAFSRLCIAIIENHQTADDSVKIPDVLQPFMGGQNKI